MQRTLQIGLAAIGVIIGFGVRVSNSDVAAQVVLACATPLVAALVIVLSLDEFRRAVQAGAHVAVLEQRVAERLGTATPIAWVAKRQAPAPPLTWETTIQLARGAGTYWPHWTRTVGLFAATVPAVVLGVVHLLNEDKSEWFAVSLGFVALVVSAVCLYQLWVHAQLKTMAARAIGQPAPQVWIYRQLRKIASR